MNFWAIFGYKLHSTQPGIYWSRCEYITNCIRDGDKYILDNQIIYREDYDNYDDPSNPIYEMLNRVQSLQEQSLMMIVKNCLDLKTAEEFRKIQNELEMDKNKAYWKHLNPDDLDIC